ncbi:MAG: hypothetical protein WAV15_03210 [Minisyncoccia bacterium]
MRFSENGRLGGLAIPGQFFVFRDLAVQCEGEHSPEVACGRCRVTGSVSAFKLFTNMLLAAGKVILGADDNVRLNGTTRETIPMHLDRQTDVEQMAIVDAPSEKRMWLLLESCVAELRKSKEAATSWSYAIPSSLTQTRRTASVSH